MGLDSDSKIELNHSLLNRMETTHVQHTPDMNSITIYVKLLDEETPTIRPTSGIHVVNNIYRLLPAPNYDPEDETWLFPRALWFSVNGETIVMVIGFLLQ